MGDHSTLFESISWTSDTVWLVIFARYLFSHFSRVKSHSRKLKPRKFCCPRVKRTNRISIPGLLLYSSLQKRVSECAFDGYHWSNPKCYVNTDARSRQWRKAESGSNRRRSPDSPIAKIKTAKISEIGILAYFAKICTHENYQPYGNSLLSYVYKCWCFFIGFSCEQWKYQQNSL